VMTHKSVARDLSRLGQKSATRLHTLVQHTLVQHTLVQHTLVQHTLVQHVRNGSRGGSVRNPKSCCFFFPTPSLSPQRAMQGTENRQVVVGAMASTQLDEGRAQPITSSTHATHVTAERKPRWALAPAPASRCWSSHTFPNGSLERREHRCNKRQIHHRQSALWP
jgi:hypothetical protein